MKRNRHSTTRARPEENATCCTSRSWPASSSCSPAPYAEEKDIIIASAVIAVTFSCAGSLACYRMKKSLHTYHENNAVLENELDAADYQNIMGCPHPWKTF